MAVKNFKELVVWQKSMEVAKMIYSLVRKLPKEELFALSDQMRRAAVSIPSNIAEGHGRSSKKELVHFLFVSLGSASELETQLILSQQLGFLPQEQFDELNNLNNEVLKMLSALIRTNN